MPSAQSPLRNPAGACRVAIVDRHRAVADMTARAVEAIPGFVVAGLACDLAAMRKLCARERPDLVVVDLVLPGSSGMGVLAEVRAIAGKTRVLIFSSVLRPELVRGALLSGAHGLVERTAPLEEFCAALRSVAAGQIHFGQTGSEEIRCLVGRGPGDARPRARLSDRERAVLCDIADGLSSKEISARLGISVHTVVHHRAGLMRKTGLRGAAQLSRYAVEMGLVEETMRPPRAR
jgi:DNA-binding NarL/FixJ family response regulator